MLTETQRLVLRGISSILLLLFTIASGVLMIKLWSMLDRYDMNVWYFNSAVVVPFFFFGVMFIISLIGWRQEHRIYYGIEPMGKRNFRFHS